MWIPTWLGDAYSKLFNEFGVELFTFKEAMSFLGFDENKLAVVFSKLHSRRILLIFDVCRPRLYRLLDPENFVLLASENIRNLDRVGQERYVKLLCDSFRALSKTFDLSSFAVYGSVAKGTAKKQSDVDVLLVSNNFSGSLGSRIDKLYKVEAGLRDELGWLRNQGIYASLSFYPLREEEAKRMPLLFLDLTEEALLLYDKEHFLEGILTDLKTKLLRLGGRKVTVDKERWYWDLKPGYKFGEEILI